MVLRKFLGWTHGSWASAAAPEVAMFGAGGLMGIKIGVSLIVGGLVNYFVLAPWIIQLGDIHPYEHPITHQVIYMNAETRPTCRQRRPNRSVCFS